MSGSFSNLKKVIMIVAIVALGAGCSTPRDSVQQQKAELEFWQWFQAHEEELYKGKYGRDHIFDALSGKMQKVSHDLTYEVSLQPSAKRDFVISADGNKAAFPDVISLAEKAPKLAHWKVLKFRQRCGTTELQCGKVLVKPNDVYFELEPDDDGYNITVFIRNYEATGEYGTIGFIFLDHALGEYVVETKLHIIKFEPLTDEVARKQKTIDKLAATMDGLSKK